MKHFRTILIIGIIEILIGGTTLIGTFGSLLLSSNTKPFNVLFFVITAATVSTLIGVGILKFKKIAYQLLLYFSSVVILSKILIFMDVLQLSGELQTIVPSVLTNTISIIYHATVIAYLKKDAIMKIFHR